MGWAAFDAKRSKQMGHHNVSCECKITKGRVEGEGKYGMQRKGSNTQNSFFWEQKRTLDSNFKVVGVQHLKCVDSTWPAFFLQIIREVGESL